MERGPRHGWSADFCDLIEQVAHGQAAQQWLSHPAFTGDLVQTLFILPMWGWTTAEIDLGRKAVGPDGTTTLLFPLRMSWSHPLIGGAAPGTSLRWQAHGMGRGLSGEVSFDARAARITALDVHIGTAEPHDLLAIVEAGTQARWAVMQMLEPMIGREVLKAHAAVAGELGVPRVLDEIGLDTVTDELVLGTEQRTSAADRFIDKVLSKTEAFTKVDPLRAARIEFYRCARQAILLAIGDPREGRKIRALAEVFRMPDGRIDLDALLTAYRDKHPADRLGRDRALAALTCGADVMASAVRDSGVVDTFSYTHSVVAA